MREAIQKLRAVEVTMLKCKYSDRDLMRQNQARTGQIPGEASFEVKRN